MNRWLVSITAAAAAAGAFAVESQNIVGYMDLTTRTGAAFELLGATFLPTGSSDLGASTTLFNAVKPGGTFTWEADSIIVYANGYKQFQATYIDAATAAEVGIAEGWWDTSCIDEEEFPSEKCRNAYVLPYGAAIAFSRALSGSKLKFAGEVLQANFTAPAPYSFNLVPNTSPKDINLFAIKPAGTFTWEADSINVYDNGYKQFTATYIDAATAAEVGIAEGWWDTSCIEAEEFPSEKCRNAYELPAGVAFAFNRALSGSRLSIPNPMN